MPTRCRRGAFTKQDGKQYGRERSGINDGAAALVIASEERARLMELAPMAKIVSYATAGVDPRLMGLGPVPAIERALEKANLGIKDIDLFELNEAFAAQSLAVVAKLGLESASVNVNGGAIALGHPSGASGARVGDASVRMSARSEAWSGRVIGGGGDAMIVER